MNRSNTDYNFDTPFADLFEVEDVNMLSFPAAFPSPDWLLDLNLLPDLHDLNLEGSPIVLTAASTSTSSSSSEPETDLLEPKKTRSVRHKRARKDSDETFVLNEDVDARASKLADEKLDNKKEKNRKATQVSRNKKQGITKSLESQVRDLEARLEESELEKERMKKEIIALRKQISQSFSNFINQ